MWASVFGGQYALYTFATWQLHPCLYLQFPLLHDYVSVSRYFSVRLCFTVLEFDYTQLTQLFKAPWLLYPLLAQCRIKLDSAICVCRAQIDTLFTAVCWFFLSSCPVMVAFEIRNLEIFWKINLDQAVRIRENNLYSE